MSTTRAAKREAMRELLQRAPEETAPQAAAATGNEVSPLKVMQMGLANLTATAGAEDSFTALDPRDCIPSKIHDRFDLDQDEEAEQLRESIRASGQQVPILVRPHLELDGKYEIAYGHRRVEACKVLGLSVLARVQDMSDEQLLTALGQENNERKSVTFIEQAVYAHRLNNEASLPQTQISLALGKPRSTVVQMCAVVNVLGIDRIKKIGRAPKIGRRRWWDLKDRVLREGVVLDELLAKEAWSTIESSDERFELVLKAYLNSKGKAPKPTPTIARHALNGETGALVLKRQGDKAQIETSNRAFGDFLEGRLADLIEEFEKMDA